MRCRNQGSPFIRERPQETDQFIGGLPVEVRRWLIHQYHSRGAHQCACQSDTLSLSARQLSREVSRPGLKLHGLQAFEGTIEAMSLIRPRRNEDILHSRERRDHAAVLRNEKHLGST